MHIDGIQGVYVAMKKQPPKSVARQAVLRVKQVMQPQKAFNHNNALKDEWKRGSSDLSFKEYKQERSHLIQSAPGDIIKRFK